LDPRTNPPPAPATPATIEDWCNRLVSTCDLAEKLTPGAPPRAWATPAHARRLERPGRPPELVVRPRSARTPRSLADPRARARVLHTFVHHELQAAELFAWAILAFPDTPVTFRAGLLARCTEELEHLARYREGLARRGYAFGDFEVRDWLWQRVTGSPDATAFVALLGIGLEGANLEHSARFAAAFRTAGDEDGARILESVGAEEVAHVAFARTWFERFTGRPLDYRHWRECLPPPLTPSMLRGKPLQREARRRAGLDEAFCAQLEAAPPTTTRRTGSSARPGRLA
jgi:uncharacterized ferritin-like protein (DUF455 family)